MRDELIAASEAIAAKINQELRYCWTQGEEYHAARIIEAALRDRVAPVAVSVTREWCEQAAKAEEAAGDPDVTVGVAPVEADAAKLRDECCLTDDAAEYFKRPEFTVNDTRKPKT